MRSERSRKSSSYIGTLKESPLHRDLKFHYKGEAGRTEQHIDKYVVDVLQGDQIVEIQTSNFGSMRSKLEDLHQDYQIKVVYPIAKKKVLVRHHNGELLRRTSPKRGNLYEIFNELIALPELLEMSGVELEVAYVHIEETRRYDRRRAWRRGHWVISRKSLVKLLDTECFQTTTDLFERVLGELTESFTTSDVRSKLGVNLNLAQKIVYCFHKVGFITSNAKQGKFRLYERA